MSGADESVEEALRREVAKRGGTFCERCKCCAMRWQVCEGCDGVGCTSRMSGAFSCGVWYEPIQCETCGGTCGWWVCSCDDKGEHHEREQDHA